MKTGVIAEGKIQEPGGGFAFDKPGSPHRGVSAEVST
jgi:hypothetical protein